MNTKEQTLINILKSLKKVVVTFSGGIDSTYLLKVAVDTLGVENVLAIIVNSELLPAHEYHEALDIAEQIGSRVLGVEMQELNDPRIAANSPEIWYYSKQLLYRTVKQYAKEEGFEIILDGMNQDDQSDFRPGLKARDEEGIRSVLQEADLYKKEIRALAKKRGITTWQKASSCSLSSRFPYGTRITREAVQQIAQTENYLKSLGFNQIRARHHGDLLRIEVMPKEFDLMMQHAAEINQYCQALGYQYVTADLLGYKYGRMNDALKHGDK